MHGEAIFPSVSIIIPTYNRAADLRETLNALAAQTWPHDRFEVVVVDDGSTDDTPAVANDTYGCRVRYLRQANQGCFAARNLGVNSSSADILYFMDDDITLEPETLAGLVKAVTARPRCIAMAAFGPWAPLDPTVFQAVHASHRQQRASRVGFTECASGNLCIARADFLAIGEWDNITPGDKRNLWGDVAFGFRANRLGFTFERCPAVVYHRDRTAADLSTASRRAQEAGRLASDLFARYPEAERYLSMFEDKSRIRLGADSPRLIVRKVLRALSAWPPVLRSLEWAARACEATLPRRWLLSPLYRWILGAYHWLGYRQGRTAP